MSQAPNLHLAMQLLTTNSPSLSLSLQSPDNQALSDKWTEIEFALQMLGISEEEAKGIWAILAAICHLGCSGVAVGKCVIYWPSIAAVRYTCGANRTKGTVV